MGREIPDLLPGTLELLILKTLVRGPLHGYAIAERLKDLSDDVQRRIEQWAKAEWGTSENNRRARYYTLTAAGRKQLAIERQDFDHLILAIQKVLNAT